MTCVALAFGIASFSIVIIPILINLIIMHYYYFYLVFYYSSVYYSIAILLFGVTVAGIMPHCIDSDTVEAVIVEKFKGSAWEESMAEAGDSLSRRSKLDTQ